MKFFTLLLITTFISTWAIAQDTIPNAGFENWTANVVPAYNNPDGWTTLNPLTGALNVFTAFKDSTVVHSGHYSIKLVTKSVAGQTAPGILTTGTVNAGSGNITGGVPIASRPAYLSGWYQYSPVSGDTAAASILLTKWDAVGDSEIIVGQASKNIGSAASSWTSFSMAINYLTNATPDTVMISFFTSATQAGAVNSTLWHDDLSYTAINGINEIENSPMSLYPNPASQQINIDNGNMQAASVNLYAVDGRFIKLIKMHEGLNTLDVSSLPAGVYILSGVGTEGNVYHSSVVIDK